MSPAIEPLENRVLLSVTPAQLQADAQALVRASSSSTAALNAVRSAEFGLIKGITGSLRKNGGIIGAVVGKTLATTLTGAGKTGYGHIQTSQKTLSTSARVTAKRSLAQGKALLKNSNDTTLQANVQDLINQLNATVPDALASLQTVLADAGNAIQSAVTAIVAVLPDITSSLGSVAQTIIQKSQAFDDALAAIPTAAAQLAVDLSSITAQGAATVTHAYVGPAPVK